PPRITEQNLKPLSLSVRQLRKSLSAVTELRSILILRASQSSVATQPPLGYRVFYAESGSLSTSRSLQKSETVRPRNLNRTVKSSKLPVQSGAQDKCSRAQRQANSPRISVETCARLWKKPHKSAPTPSSSL